MVRSIKRREGAWQKVQGSFKRAPRALLPSAQSVFLNVLVYKYPSKVPSSPASNTNNVTED
jgi:hypothetical protein